MKILVLTKKDDHKIEITSWAQFIALIKSFDARAILMGIQHFIITHEEGGSDPDDVIHILSSHEEGQEILCKAYYEGGMFQGYILDFLKQSLLLKHCGNVAKQAIENCSFKNVTEVRQLQTKLTAA